MSSGNGLTVSDALFPLPIAPPFPAVLGGLGQTEGCELAHPGGPTCMWSCGGKAVAVGQVGAGSVCRSHCAWGNNLSALPLTFLYIYVYKYIKALQ